MKKVGVLLFIGPKCLIQLFSYIFSIYISDCKNCGYVEQVQGVKWYVSQEAGFIFKAVKPVLFHCYETLELRMTQRWIGWGVIRYLLYMYISYLIIYRIYSRHKVSLTWDQKPIPLDLCSDACSAELASLTQERSSTINVCTRSHIKEHKVLPECWQLSRSELHLR